MEVDAWVSKSKLKKMQKKNKHHGLDAEEVVEMIEKKAAA